MADREVQLTFNERGNPVVWLTWALRENGVVELRAMSLTTAHLDYVRGCCRNDMNWPGSNLTIGVPTVRFWTEKREAEHLLGTAMIAGDLAMAHMVKTDRSKWLVLDPDSDGPEDATQPGNLPEETKDG